MSVFHTPVLAGASGNQGSHQIEQSLRFNPSDSAFLNQTPASSGDRTTWTWSAWIKRSEIGSTMGLFGSYTISNNSNYTEILFASGNTLLVQGNSIAWLNTSQVFRDSSAWYHIVVVFDTKNSTADDRIRIYVNGEEINDFGTRNNPGLGVGLGINQAGLHRLGRRPNGTDYFSGYMAEVNFIDGSALAPTNFGELDDNGVWRPIKYAGSYTGNSFYLKFASGDGTDSSGLSNTWTANNFTTSGTGTDVMSDTPTTNWCTLNPLNTGAAYTLANGNLDFTSSTNWDGTTGTFVVSSGKWYYEFTRGSGTSGLLGWCEPQNYDITTEPGDPANSSVWRYRDDGTKRNGEASGQSYGATWTTPGDVIGCALDLDAGTIAFYKNGTSQGTAYSNLSGKTLVPVIGFYNCTAASSVNFGQRDFAHTPPTGFNALNTSNLPAPDIADGSENFNTVIYTGASPSDRAVTGVGFQPDFTWIKARTQGYNHALYDAVRGATRELHSNTTDVEDTDTNGLKTFDPDGFTVGSDGEVGDPTGTRVSWNWLAGNGTSTPSGGSIASTVSANPSAGFSIVSYVGTQAADTIAHGLGVAPSMIICKDRDVADRWPVYHSAMGNAHNLRLDNGSLAQESDSGIWNSTSPTSNVFSVGTSVRSNRLNSNYIAYCFAEVEGYSKFGSYTGNGNADGPFVYCGFRPRWIMTRAYTRGTEWVIWDTARDPYNVAEQSLQAQSNSSELTFYDIDILSNGFKVRTSFSTHNQSGQSYLFAAFAEHPTGGDGVSPAPAR